MSAATICCSLARQQVAELGLPLPLIYAPQYRQRLNQYLQTYDKAFIVHADNVGSRQFMDIRKVGAAPLWERSNMGGWLWSIVRMRETGRGGSCSGGARLGWRGLGGYCTAEPGGGEAWAWELSRLVARPFLAAGPAPWCRHSDGQEHHDALLRGEVPGGDRRPPLGVPGQARQEGPAGGQRGYRLHQRRPVPGARLMDWRGWVPVVLAGAVEGAAAWGKGGEEGGKTGRLVPLRFGGWSYSFHSC